MDPQAGRGDHPEGALAAHEQLGEVGAGGRPGAGALGAHHGPVGQDDLEADHHVLDLPVAGRVLARAPTGQPPADRGQVHGLGEVAEGVAVADRQGRLDVGTEQPRRDVGHQRRLVDDDRPHQAGAVEGDPAKDRNRPTAHPAAAGHGGHRHAGRRAGGQGGGHLGGVGRAHHRRRPGRDLAPDGPADGQGPPVAPGGTRSASPVRTSAPPAAIWPTSRSSTAAREPAAGRRRAEGSASTGVRWGGGGHAALRRVAAAVGSRPPPARPGPVGEPAACSAVSAGVHPSSGASSSATRAAACAARPGRLQQGAGPPGQHVVDRGRHLVAGGVDHLGSRGRPTPRPPARAARAALRPRPAPGGPRCRSARPGGRRPGRPAGAGDPVPGRGAPRSRSPLVTQGPAPRSAGRAATTWAMVSSAILR